MPSKYIALGTTGITGTMFGDMLDPQILAFQTQVYKTPLIQDVIKKYLHKPLQEESMKDVFQRVAKAIANSPAETPIKNRKRKVTTEKVESAFYEMMMARLFVPGGRILAGAGTAKRVTLMNCYVNGTLEDSIEGIADGKKRLLITSSMGGGVGTDFSPLRPYNAQIQRLGSASSGAVSFMDTFNADGKTIRSAGERRAAQMGTISDTHPDLIEFIKAKGEGLKNGTNRLAEFNVSILVSDAFKAAVDDDEEWLLFFHIPPAGERDPSHIAKDFVDDDGVKQYVYSVWKARDLWELITKYTYEFSDPGVIFIDRINELNNLSYCEEIRCTNPCGEQPLPPNGTCNLGAINVANVVRKPFTKDAEVNYELLAEIAKWGIRFLDNVIDVTEYPLPEQRDEEYSKRRVGLGILGLGTLFAELGIRYGSVESVQVARKVMKTIALSAYNTSIELAVERGRFPLYKDDIIDCGFINARLDDDMKEMISEKGLRNGVLLTIAPTGTGAIAIGNVSSGLEPDFAHEYERRVRKNNTEEYDLYLEKSYTKRFYEFCTGKSGSGVELPDYMVVASQLSVEDHIKVQAALQEWVDASTSKTINIPVDMPYEEFLGVYELAYLYGCKGCTTYRPSDYRASILSAPTDSSNKNPGNTLPYLNGRKKRPEVLSGSTYKLKWPSLKSSLLVTINYLDDQPYEILFACKDAKFQDWFTSITLMISYMMRSGIDLTHIPAELKSVVSTNDTAWIGGKFYGSIVELIGDTIEQDFIAHNVILGSPNVSAALGGGEKNIMLLSEGVPLGDTCPACSKPTLIHKEGCADCLSCGYSKCA